MNDLKVGARVTVVILSQKGWHSGAVASMNGKSGTVERTKDRESTGHSHKLKAMVLFDEPAAPWSANQLPATGFWFDHDELEVC